MDATAMLQAWQAVAREVRLVSMTDRVDLQVEDPEAAMAEAWQEGASQCRRRPDPGR